MCTWCCAKIIIPDFLVENLTSLGCMCFYFLFSPPLVTEIAEQKNMNLNLCLTCLMLPVFPKSHSSELRSVVSSRYQPPYTGGFCFLVPK